MNEYYPVIGIEVHAELATNSKMFCACKNDADETRPNVNICPVCMAHPGTLPVPNKQAIENVIKVGLAINADIANFSEFDRKNYFYPDIPKGYQITQYKYPIVSNGHLADFDITRIHLEEDTANSKHDRGDFSLIDYNRAGVPLMELVTEAHMFDSFESAAKATGNFGRELQLLLQYLGVGEANMEKGEMRVEANISLARKSKLDEKGVPAIVGRLDLTKYKGALGTKTEVKNLNSFRSVERAVMYELNRMKELIEAGRENELVQETRGWDENKQVTFSQRAKEDAHDYRYFPEPDIPKFYLHELFDLPTLKMQLRETPSAKRLKLKQIYKIKDEDIEVYVNNFKTIGHYFENVAPLLDTREAWQALSNFLTSDVMGIVKTKGGFHNINVPYFEDTAELVNMFIKKEISSRTAKDLIAIMMEKNIHPREYAEEHGLFQKNDIEGLRLIVQKAIDENPGVVESYKAGKENAIMALVGKIIKESGGSANPQLVIETLKELLK